MHLEGPRFVHSYVASCASNRHEIPRSCGYFHGRSPLEGFCSGVRSYNQLRQKIGVVYGNPEMTTGGNALKFYASVRLDIRKIGTVKNG